MNKFNAAKFWEMLLPELGEKYLSKYLSSAKT